MDEYLEWYFALSHPQIIPPRQLVDDVGHSRAGPSVVGGPFDDVPTPPPPPHGAYDAEHL